MLRFTVGLAVALAMCACTGKAPHDDHEGHNHEGHSHDHAIETRIHDEHDHHGHVEAEAHDEHEGHSHAGDEIVLPEGAAGRFGVETGEVASGDFAVSYRASGTVAPSGVADAVVSAPTAGIVHFAPGVNVGSDVSRGSAIATIDARGMSGGDSNAAAKAALDAAQTEYDRIETLYKEQLATVGERNAALAALNAAKAAYSPAASTGRATSPIAGTVTSFAVRQGQYVNAGDIIATVAAAGDLTLRIDLPQKHYSQAPQIADAVVEFPYLTEAVSLSSLGGRRIGSTPIAAQGQPSAYVPIYFSVPRGSGIIPGSTFTAYLLGAPRHDVVTVPVSALSEQQGQYFVYELMHADEGSFVKVPVRIGATDGRRVEIVDGIHPGATIVVNGVTTVRLAEAGANIPEGHSHNH